MAVIIDEVSAEMESEPAREEERQQPKAEAPPQAQVEELRRRMRQIERRQTRLKAD